MASKKVPIDYLQFLNRPELDETSNLFYFTYLEPETELIKRVEHENSFKIEELYNNLRAEIIKLQKKRKVVIDTNVVVKKKKKAAKKNTFVDKKDHKNKLIIKEINTKALELKIEGYDKTAIYKQLMSTYKISSADASTAILECYRELAKDVDEDFIRFTVLSHSQHYDELYKRFMSLDAPKIAMRSLKTKETLNGIGQDIFEIQVNNVFEDPKDIISYGMGHLNESEQKEFIEILSRINATNEDKQRKLKNS